MSELDKEAFVIREIGELEGKDFSGVILEGSHEAIRAAASFFGQKVVVRALSSVAERAEGEAVAQWRATLNAIKAGGENPTSQRALEALCEKMIGSLFAHPSPVGVKESPMQFFSENVDHWGAAEWFDRLAKAIHKQDGVVLLLHNASTNGKDTIELEGELETYRNIAASSAMRLVREFEQQVRSALIPSPSATAVGEETQPDEEISPYEWLACEFDRLAILRKMWAANEVAAMIRRHDIDRRPVATAPSVGEITEEMVERALEIILGKKPREQFDDLAFGDAPIRVSQLRERLTAALSSD